MKQRYTIRVESNNPEFDTCEWMREGVKADGYLLLITRDGVPAVSVMHGMSIIELAKFFCRNDEVCSSLQQAAAIGEGMRKAEKIRAEAEKKSNGLDALLQAIAIANRKKQELDDLK